MLHLQHSHRDFISLLLKNSLDHVAENILSYLDAKSLCAAELVCKEWHQVISEGMLWKKLIERLVRTDSLWRRLMEQRGLNKDLFKPSPGEPHPNHMFYRRLYPKVIQDIENIETNWRCGLYTLKRINCQSENSKGVYCVQYDDHKIVSGLRDNTIKIWDRNTLECIQVLTGHDGPVECLLYDDRAIISGSSGPTVRVWDVKTGELINTLNSHDEAAFYLRFNNGMSVSCCEELSMTLWTVWNMASDSKITRHSLFVHGVRVAHSVNNFGEKYVAFTNGLREIDIWNCSAKKFVRTLVGHKRGVVCLQYRGRLVVSGSIDKTIKLWDIESGACLRTLEGHEDCVTCIQFDNKRIVSGASDGEIKVWDLAAALDPRAPAETLCLRTLVEHSGSISTLQFDNFQIVSSSSDDTIVIWDFLNGTPPETSALNMNICVRYVKNVFENCFQFCCPTNSSCLNW